MASWATETPENVNYTKLCRLLYDGGTRAARSVLDINIPASSSLVSELNNYKPRLQLLMRPTRRVLGQNQWDKLYPPGGAIRPKSEDFDITLLFVLLRNICGLTKPSTGWDALPPPADNTLEANLVRVKYYRNEVIAHSSSAEIDDVQFEDYWKKISSALVSLGLKQDDIDDLKSFPLGTEDYNQLVYDWHLSDEKIKSQLGEIKADTKEIKLETAKHTSAITNIESDVAEIKARLPSSTPTLNIDNLIHHDFNSLIGSLNSSYHPDTRQWILDQVKTHVESKQSDPILVIQAGPGMGKSVVAARICKIYKEQGILGGCHFFQHSHSLRNNPRLMFQSVARQLCDAIPGYQAALEKKLQPHEGKLSGLGCEELFTELFETCCNITSDNNVVIVIDALDECCNTWKKELYHVILNRVSCLPRWLRFVITTRPPPSISAIENLPAISIVPEDEQNQRDLQSFFINELKELGHVCASESSYEISKLVELTEGLFLVAYFLIDLLKKKNVTSLPEALEHFPKGKGITSVYEDYFTRLRKALAPHLNDEEGFFRMLDAVVAANFPIEKQIFYSILGLTPEPRIPNRERKEAIHLLHQLIPVENDHVTVFHKTVIDWMTTGNHDFKVKDDGSGILANACFEVLDDIRKGLKEPHEPFTLSNSEEYALEFGLEYMDEEKKRETQTNCFVFCSSVLFIVKSFCESKGIYLKQDWDWPFARNFGKSLSKDFKDIYHQILKTFPEYHDKHQSSCCFHDLPTFGQCVDFVLQAANLLKVDQVTPNPLAYLVDKGIPYVERQILHTEEVFETVCIEFLAANDRFLIVKYLDQQTSAQEYQFDGTLVNKVNFAGEKKMLMSPGNEFIVVAPVHVKGNIDILDAKSLQTHTSFKPPNVIRSCHVYGNSESWYIVTRCFNNKIYRLKGETGEEDGDPTVVQQNDEIMAVSKVGHILLERTCSFLYERNSQFFFKDEDENAYSYMIWVEKPVDGHPRDGHPVRGPNGISRELFLCDNKTLDQRIHIYPPRSQAYVCECEEFQGLSLEPVKLLTKFGQPVCFSDEGNLLAFYYGGLITIVNTSDGSLYECINSSLYPLSCIKNILFLSLERIVLQDDGNVFIFQIRPGERTTLKHTLFLQPNTEASQILSTINQENKLKTISFAKRVEGAIDVDDPSRLLIPFLVDPPKITCYFEMYQFHKMH